MDRTMSVCYVFFLLCFFLFFLGTECPLCFFFFYAFCPLAFLVITSFFFICMCLCMISQCLYPMFYFLLFIYCLACRKSLCAQSFKWCMFSVLCMLASISVLISGPITVSVQRGTCHMCTDCGDPEIKTQKCMASNLRWICICNA